MSLLTLLVMSIGLAMDAFAVSVSNGMCVAKMRLKQALIFAFAFGLAQGIMPCIGWLAGQVFASYIQQIDHWVALILLSFIGVKMIVETIKELRNPKEECPAGGISAKTIFIQAVATSIDALAVGVSLAAMNVDIIYAAAMIAGVTFVICLAGAYLGKSVGRLLKDKAEIFGGVVLILLGIKIFIEDVFFS
ncbi:manganese efflux pump MntP family protein [Acetanaerobacterium elongatum]|uniref:Putative manganese efflux pump MntP n=1 Tax=Acetanaerobacterium elongatum TaxID=258515 RepID=A0A1G9WVY4_9FIRM|nr:manganese efflux pump MntP family protein [Acetanaerobacterium elongatum]SDM88610.1 Putative Mn2+ efflux pump MntP [Acetanaerobacterium elongatum]